MRGPPTPHHPVTTPLSARLRLVRRVDAALSAHGLKFRRLLLVNASAGAGDVLVALALAGTLFFSVPSTEARANVALYLVVTLAPFAVLAPALGAVLVRVPTAYRHGLVLSCSLRSLTAVVMALQVDSLWLYPLAFLLLVLSRLFAISRASLLPLALEQPVSLVAANARLAQIGVVAAVMAVPVGLGAQRVAGAWLALAVAAVTFAAAAVGSGALSTRPVNPVNSPAAPASALPRPAGLADAAVPASSPGRLIRAPRVPRPTRLAQLATAGVRLINGFLLLLLAFALREAHARLLDFGALLAAAGAGYFLASLTAPWFERRLREEPMVVVALALEAAAAFVAAQAFGVAAAAALAAAAGLAWGMAKFAFDGLLQSALPLKARAVAFTRAETLFAIAWVVGAIIPTGLMIPVRVGLGAAGMAALAAQVVYVSVLLVPPRAS